MLFSVQDCRPHTAFPLLREELFVGFGTMVRLFAHGMFSVSDRGGFEFYKKNIMPFIPNARRTKEKTMPDVFEASGMAGFRIIQLETDVISSSPGC